LSCRQVYRMRFYGKEDFKMMLTVVFPMEEA
jgi:hypothetical protein